MADTPETRTRAVLLGYFPMFIATLSLLTSIYNGYLNSKFVDLIQSNVGRVEYMKSCREIIDTYFQVKVRLGVLNAAGDKTAGSIEQTEAALSGEPGAQSGLGHAEVMRRLADRVGGDFPGVEVLEVGHR